MHLTRTVHALSTNTTHRLHAFYTRVGAAIPSTSTVHWLALYVTTVKTIGTYTALVRREKRLEWNKTRKRDVCREKQDMSLKIVVTYF